ncbi:hypothetical protein [Dactylococcopsis salina]|uniref:hypothetical protein n=1 Tax=Dactylococcopsis salina TaxID=292566 RepID=UPI0012EA0E59|nr:hypothetical protein [Dactylococcopsis salina]
MLKKSIGWFSKARGLHARGLHARGKRQKACMQEACMQEARCVTIEQSMNLHFYLNLIASNPYLVKLSVLFSKQWLVLSD